MPPPVHPRSVLEVEKDKNIINKSALLSKIKTYSSLDSQSNPFDDKDFFTVIQKPKSERDTVDSYLLYCLYKKEVDLFLTEDVDIIEKAEQLNISSRVMNLKAASNFFKKRLEESKTKDSNVPVFSFFKKGNDWYIGEKGNEVRFNDMNGFAYIHYLLGYVNQNMPAVTIYNLGKVSVEKDYLREISQKERIDLHLHLDAPIFNKRLSAKDKEFLQLSIDQLKKGIDDDDNDCRVDEMDKEKRIKIKIKIFENLLNEKSDRDYTSQSSRNRISVTKAIKNALLKIREDRTASPVAKYLNESTIKTGGTCIYKPLVNDTPSWILYYEENNQ